MSAGALSAPDATRLIRNLEAQLAGYRGLVALAERQYAGLVGGRSDDVSEVIGAQQETLLTLQTLEQERLTLLGTGDGGGGAEPTLRELAGRTAPPARGRLETLGADLLSTAETLRGLDRRNAHLLRRSVATLTRWRSYMVRSFLRSETYTADGGAQPSDGPWALDEAA